MRWAHHLYANTFGYFWMDCALCGKGFGGHQWRGPLADWMNVTKGVGRSQGKFCPSCAKQLKIRTEELGIQLAPGFHRPIKLV